MKTHKFARKPFYVDAVRVSEANMEEVAEWCQGEILVDDDEQSPTHGQKYIKVKVHRPLTDDQTRAFIGKWVLFAGTGFKVYNPKAFDKSFEKVKTLTKAQADEAGIKVPHEPRPAKKGGAIKHAEKKPQRKRPVPQPPKNPVLTPADAAKLAGTPKQETEVAQEVAAEVKENAVKNEAAAAGVNVEFSSAEQKQTDEVDALITEVTGVKPA